MLGAWSDSFNTLLGLHVESKDLTFAHMAARALVVFCFAILLSRVADRRFMGRNAGFDFMLAIILGSVLSRGINGQAAFLPTLGASAVLILLHIAVGALAFRSHVVSRLVKGGEVVLIRDGKVQESALARCRITQDDLHENLRVNANVDRVEEVAEARLERNGTVSVIKKKN